MAPSCAHHLARMTTEEVAEARRAAGLAIIPVGATEQHGPHLALETDTRIATEFAARLADELGDEAILCPALPYGLSEHHERFAGTLTLGTTAFMAVLLDLIASLSAQGFDKVIIVNGHGGNMEALALVTRRARSELGALVASMMWGRLARDVCAAEASGEAYGHACEIETSLALVLAPELVRENRIAEPHLRLDVDRLSAPRGYVDIAVRFDELTSDGVYGDPTKASRDLGERILATALERAVAFARRFAKDGTVV